MDQEGEVCLSSEDLDSASPQGPGLTLDIEQSHGQLSRHLLAHLEETMLAADDQSRPSLYLLQEDWISCGACDYTGLPNRYPEILI